MNSKQSSEQKVLLVTGGSRGIGAATCLQAANMGFTVIVNYASNKAAADQVVDRIHAASGNAVAMQADVGDEAQVLELFKRIDLQFGRLDALVNNAGVVDVTAKVVDMRVERLMRMFNTNVIGTFVVTREALKRMKTGASIVNLSSAAARLGSPAQYVDYAASKGAIDTFTLGLAKEVAEQGIRVNAVRPGLIYTDIHASGGLPNRVDDHVHQVPMKRGGTAEEVANGICWLLSDAASYVTGSILDVTGGR